ncbi:hypothetical protein SZ64_11785 [Erythrobacter sp. SG61-1L]|uniref:hypothetical protein n=1 Tax=Erythrobacter sp. SG61-1L TaxID=1603897 RepID=UPI0006C9184A|nr:hypothetical protein [Erythrobacter sp. SG61-1L]KPL68714.1 hypothetical protein SZ64_11785 [Erythrobacter sp. SG61-1L]
MTRASGEIAGGTAAGSASDAVRDWEAVRANADIQFAPVQMPEQAPPPDWLLRFLQWLGEVFRPIADALGLSWPVFKWILLGIAVLAVLALLWRLLAPIARIRFAGSSPSAPDEGWAPERSAAIALLEDADRLAAEGRFDEATHLLLQRSVAQIAQARPDWLEPSSTAREIAALPALPDNARRAFSTIATRVERSLFALRRLESEDWLAARAAYADFALADFRSGAAA